MAFELYVKEVFVSIQGEGTICLGRKQIFLRTSFCHMRCFYCDTDYSKSQTFPVCRSPNAGPSEIVANPVSVEQIGSIVSSLATPDVHSVSLTGGEPLVIPPAELRLLCTELKRHGLRIYLETSGTLPDRLNEVIDLVDYVSMDVKLPSAEGKSWWTEHSEFLRISRQVPTFVKVVVYPTNVDEVRTAASVVADVDPAIDFILQPETQTLKNGTSSNSWLWPLWEAVSQRLQNVHLIPQTHAFLGLQ